jgi:hypothetical protein
MKRVYLIMAMVVIGGALTFQGCGGLKQVPVKEEISPPPVKILRAEKASETTTQPARIIRDEAPDKKAEFVPEKREIIYDRTIIPFVHIITPEDFKKYPPLKPTQRRNMAQIRQRMEETGLRAEFIDRLHLVRNKTAGGKWVINAAKDVLYLGRWERDRTGTKVFTPAEIAECGNAADGFKEVVTPAKIFLLTIYHDRELVTMVERYRDLQVQECPPPYQCPSVLLTDEERKTTFKWHWVGGAGGDGGGAGGCGGGGPGGR